MNISGIGPSFGGFTYNPIKLNNDINVHARDNAAEDIKAADTKKAAAKQEIAAVAYESQVSPEGSVRMKPQVQAVNPMAVRGAENFDF